MSREIWLHTNRRAAWFSAIFVAIFSAVAVRAIGWLPIATAQRMAAFTAVGAAVLTGMVLAALLRPRLARQDGRLLVYLRSGAPISLPIEIVECFFLGQGPSMLPVLGKSGEPEQQRTSTVVVRLAESAKDWKDVEVRPGLGQWRDGYIIIRGTWCEPISGELVHGLNQKLIRARRGIRGGEMERQA